MVLLQSRKDAGIQAGTVWPVVEVRLCRGMRGKFKRMQERSGALVHEGLRCYLLHGLEQGLSVVLESHDQLQLGASGFHG